MIAPLTSTHETFLNRYTDAFKHGRIAHAHLIHSLDGGGGIAFALNLAEMLINKDITDIPGRTQLAKFEHPDLTFSFPVIASGSSSEHADSTLFIDQFRNQLQKSSYFTYNSWSERISDGTNKKPIIYTAESKYISKKLSLKSFTGGNKVLMMWLPELLHESAANKLLKLIEEPPENTYFILITHEPEAVLPTIRSRCQLLKLPAAAVIEINDYLVREYPEKTENFTFISNAADGSIGKAIEMMNDASDHYKAFETFRKILRSLYSGEMISTVNQVEELSSMHRVEIKYMLDQALRLFRASMLHQAGISQNNTLQGEELDFAVKYSSLITPDGLQEKYEILNDAVYHLDRNANVKILLLDVFLKIGEVMKRTQTKKTAV
jgi:DNA polymerase-3 subunit delta'